jgi:parallel beta-helix repeat protein
MKTIYIVCMIALLGAMMVTSATATTWDVCENESIQDALNIASDGDTVFVHAGTYLLPTDSDIRLYVNKPNITLKGEGADLVTIDGNEGGYLGIGVAGYAGGTADASGFVFEGFTVINHGRGVCVFENSPNCIIRNNVIEVSDIAVMTLSPNTTIKDNIINGGKYLRFKVPVTFMNNVVSNTTYKYYAVSIRADDSVIVNNTIINNDFGASSSRALSIKYASNCTITDNTITNNNGDGIRLWKTSTANNTITRNNVFSNTRCGICLRDAGSGNKIYLNNIMDNPTSIIYLGTLPAVTYWNSTEPMEYTYNGSPYTNYLGNYWSSDYGGSDGDGDRLGDTSYVVGLSEDHRPLMEPWETFFTPPEPPELTVTAITPATLYTGIPNTITATIANNGGNADDSFNVSLKAGDLVIATGTVDSLYAEKTIDFSWTPESTGTVSLTVTVDTENVIEESDETNNAMTVSAVIEIPYPDLHPTSFIPPATPYLNEPNTVTATVMNSGVISAGSFSVSLVVDDEHVDTRVLDPLEVGDEQSVEFSWTPASTGTVSLTVTVDPDNLIEEFDETNNDLSTLRFVTIPGYDWQQFHYDITNIGFSPSYAPGTNETLWISEDIGAVKSTSTVIAEGKVFANCGNSLTAMDIFTGELLWNTSIDSTTEWGSWLSPSYHDGKVFISGKSVYCIDAGDGAITWKYELQESACNAGTSVVDGKVFASDWDGRHYYCLDEETGGLLWKFNVGSYAQSVPAVADGKVYLSDWGTMYCLYMNGTEIWRHTISGDWAEGGNFCGSPTVSDGVVYAGTYNFYGDGSLSALDATDGTLLWSKAIQRTDSTPVVAYGNVYITGGCTGYSGKQTYCFDATDGSLIWTTDPAEAIGGWTCSAAVADGKVFVGKPGGYFDYTGSYALDAFTGDVIWSYPAGGASPAVADGIVFTIGEGRVYAFYTLPAAVRIEPETLNLNASGVFTAFVTLPEGYDVADIDVNTVECEGASALSGRIAAADSGTLIVKFARADLVDVPVGDAVELSVTGKMADGRRFEGSDMVRVISERKRSVKSKN